MEITVGTIVGGDVTAEGVTLHVISDVREDVSAISFTFFPPDHPEYSAALERLRLAQEGNRADFTAQPTAPLT